MKKIAYLPVIVTVALVASIALTTGCGQAPAGNSSGNADQLAALEKENSSLKTKLANVRHGGFALLHQALEKEVDSALDGPAVFRGHLNLHQFLEDFRY